MRHIHLAVSSAVVLAGLFAQGVWAACYVVYGPDKQVVYRAQVPPVDMSRQVHETLPQVAPGGTMVFSLDSTGCELTVNKLPLEAAAQPASRRGTTVRRVRRAQKS